MKILLLVFIMIVVVYTFALINLRMGYKKLL